MHGVPVTSEGQKYALVRAFDIPSPTAAQAAAGVLSMNVIDLASLAQAVTSAAVDYSYLSYMCLWWTNCLYLALRQVCEVRLELGAGSIVDQKGPEFANAGVACGLVLVSPKTARPLLVSENVETIIGNMRKQQYSAGVAVDDKLFKKAQQKLLDDVNRAKQQGEPLLLTAVIGAGTQLIGAAEKAVIKVSEDEVVSA